MHPSGGGGFQGLEIPAHSFQTPETPAQLFPMIGNYAVIRAQK